MTVTRRWLGGLLAGALLLVAATPARAQELDQFLPADTTFVVRVNVKQILSSELLRRAIPAIAHKHGDQFIELAKTFGALDENLGKAIKDGVLENFIAAMKDRDKVNQGLDTFKQFLTEVAFTSDFRGEEPKFLIFVRSPVLTPALMGMMLGFVEQSQPGVFKKEKLGKHLLYEIAPPNQEQKFYMVLPANGWVLLAADKDYLKTSLEAADAGKTNVSKELKALLGQFKPTHSVFFAGLKNQEGKDQISVGSVTIDDGVGVNFTLNASSADAAKEQAKELNDKIEEALSTVTGLLGEADATKGLVKELEGIKAKTDGSKVVIQVRLPAKIFDPLLKIEKKDEEKKDKSDKKDDK